MPWGIQIKSTRPVFARAHLTPPRSTVTESPNYWKYWAKSDKDDQGNLIGYHLLPYHLMDVAAAAYALMGVPSRWRDNLCEAWGLSSDQVRDNLTVAGLAHDLGKFSYHFQQYIPNLRAQLGAPQDSLDRGATLKTSIQRDPSCKAHHTTTGFLLWKKARAVRGLLPAHPHEAKAIFFHHGWIPLKEEAHVGRNSCVEFFTPGEAEDASNCFRDTLSVTGLAWSSVLSKGEDLEPDQVNASWLFNGLLTIADWLGSSHPWFPFVKDPMSLGDYWHNHALPNGARAFRESRILLDPPRGTWKGFSGDFPGYTPRPAQEVCATQVDLENDIVVLEDQTGSGKTEAAFVLAHRWVSEGHADGVYFALPTQTTAAAIYDRSQKGKWTRLLYKDYAPPPALIHGRVKQTRQGTQQWVDFKGYLRDENVGEEVSAWLVSNQRTSMLSLFASGTVDQALMAATRSRFASFRMAALSRQVLIVDEVHAYDAYMTKILCALVKAHRARGGKTILMSATLTSGVKRMLLREVCESRGGLNQAVSSPHYPLITAANSTGHVSVFPIPGDPGLRRTLSFDRVAREEDVASRILDMLRQGKNVCWIRNTVTQAQQSYFQLLSTCTQEGLADPLLFHSRFTPGDRDAIEKQVLGIWGKDGDPALRHGRLLIATQVVEQSLDLDFSEMVIDLCPFDLLLQRAGRYRRHSRQAQGEALSKVESRPSSSILVLSPDPNDVAPGWYADVLGKGANWVYKNKAHLHRTAVEVFGRPSITVPDDLRSAMERVFSEDYSDVPSALVAETSKAMNQNKADAYLASMGVHTGLQTYAEGAKEQDSRSVTRLGSPTTTLVFVRENGTGCDPWSGRRKGYPPWESGEITVYSSQVNDSDPKTKYADTLPSDRVSLAENTVQDMGKRGKYCFVLPLGDPVNGVWSFEMANDRGKPISYTYSPLYGLHKETA